MGAHMTVHASECPIQVGDHPSSKKLWRQIISGGLPKPFVQLICGTGPTQYDAPWSQTGKTIKTLHFYLPANGSFLGGKGFILFVFTDSSSKPAFPSPHWTPEVYNTKGKKSLIASLIYIVISFQAGTEETWVYPSQQMFFNALLRKGGNNLKQEYVWFIWNYSSFKWPP